MQPNDKLEHYLDKLLKSNNKVADQICCLIKDLSPVSDTIPIVDHQIQDCAGTPIGSPIQAIPTITLNKVVSSICNTADITTPIVDAINKKKDFEPLVLCDISNGEPVIVTYEYDDTGLLVFTQQNPDGTPFLGTPGKCPSKNYGITSKEWFCLTATQTNITREDIVDLDTSTPIASLWRDEIGTVIPAPTAGTFTVGVCTLPIACLPTISEAFGNDLSTLLPSNNFSIQKPTCCKIKITTSVGSFHVLEDIGAYTTSDFDCTITITNVEIVKGNCTLDKIYIIGNKIN